MQYPLDGETRGDFVRLVDWAAPARNEWLAVNQFSITGPHHTRRPDIILFVNGLPLVLTQVCQLLTHSPVSSAANPHGCWGSPEKRNVVP